MADFVEEIVFDKKHGIITLKMKPSKVIEIYKKMLKFKHVEVEIIEEGFVVSDGSVEFHAETPMTNNMYG
jgi:dsDNA-specific endonuclease/ATPase MutS2